MECISNQGYDMEQKKFRVNINKNNWIESVLELCKTCVDCDNITKCTKFDLFRNLLSNNANNNREDPRFI